MTIAELIKALSAYPPAMPVAVGGFDGWGLNDATTVEAVTVQRSASQSCVAPHYDEPGAHDTHGDPLQVISIGG